MPRHGYFLWIVLLGVAASIPLACGSPQSQRQIVNLSVSPAAADAQDYRDGQVPFIATGTYTTPPVTVTPLQATWVVIDQSGLRTTEVSINANGLAQCEPAASGVYTVGAWTTLLGSHGIVCDVLSPFGNPCGDSVLGIAQLTCP